ncbi:hypothetical protein Tco_1379374, partial [Tanacetum coccineum]
MKAAPPQRAGNEHLVITILKRDVLPVHATQLLLAAPDDIAQPIYSSAIPTHKLQISTPAPLSYVHTPLSSRDCTYYITSSSSSRSLSDNAQS